MKSLRCVLLIGLAVVLPALGWAEEMPMPGVVVSKTELPETQFVGSPSIVILPNGDYVASHDFFGKKAPKSGWTLVFKSKDRGVSWVKVAELEGLTWANLCWLKSGDAGALYLMGVKDSSKGGGDFVVRKSVDGGMSWTKAEDGGNGVILEGKFHTAPVPVVVHEGRIWRAMEELVNKKGWPRYFGAMVISAPVGADLLKAKSWTRTNAMVFDADWIKGARPGWLEGNVVLRPDGKLVDVIRTYALADAKSEFEFKGIGEGIPRYELAGMLEVSNDGKKVSFDPKKDFFRLPGSQAKFTIRFDAVSKRYWSLVNKITVQHEGRDAKTSPLRQRNVVMLVSSEDLRNWTEVAVILSWSAGKILTEEGRHGFQYLDWQFDGEDIVAVSRTAWGKARNYHDAEALTFHRVKGFREKVRSESSEL